MAGSTIISTAWLLRELPPGANDDDDEITDAVFQATDFVNTWANKYDPFDEYDTSPDAPRAPHVIVRATLEVAKAIYFLRIGQIFRDGQEQTSWQDVLAYYQDYLMKVQVSPEWKTQAVSLDSNNAMVIGSLTTGHMYPRVIPQTAQVISGSSNTWLQPDDFTIAKGGRYDDDDPQAWYLYADSSSVEGTLRYMRTYRNDFLDYGKYQD